MKFAKFITCACSRGKHVECNGKCRCCGICCECFCHQWREQIKRIREQKEQRQANG